MRKFLSVLLCVTMLVTLMFSTVGFAAVYTYDGITKDTKAGFTVPVGDDDATVLTVKAYKVIDLKFNDDGLFVGYEFNSAVKTWLSSHGYSELATATNPFAVFNSKDAEYYKEFYSALAGALQDPKSGLSLTPITGVLSSDKANFEFNDASLGQYLVSITGGKYIYSPTVVNLIPESRNGNYEVANKTAEVKKQPITITKKIKEGSTLVDTAVRALNETADYVISALVPQFPDTAVNKTFVISDALESGLTYDASTLAVKGVTATGDTDVLTGGPAYTVETEAGKIFKFNFVYASIKKYSKIEITYTAKLNGSATVGEDGNVNTVTLQYPNNPTIGGSFKTVTDEPVVYTFGVDVFKYYQEHVNNAENPYNMIKLQGAEFKLERLTNETWEQIGGTKVSDNDGKLFFAQLKEGTYRLTEVKAPDGFIKVDTIPTFTITANKVDSNYTGTIKETNLGYQKIEVQNFKTVLPSTGGNGTVIFTIVGISLMLGAVVFMVIRKRLFTTVK